MISKKLAFSLLNVLKKAGCTECYIFGSHATGNNTKKSDIDIGVKGLKPEQFFLVHSQLEDIAKTSVDLVDFDEKRKFFTLLQNLGELRQLG